MKFILPVFNVIMGVTICSAWLRDITSGKFTGVFLKWREGEAIMWPHITIELLTALTLLLSGIGMLLHAGWAEILAVFALGALFYASFESLSWSLTQSKRWPYSVIMIIGIGGSLAFITVIITELTR